MIALAQDLGARGQAAFSASVLHRKGYWDDLATGPEAIKAVMLSMPWRQSQAGRKD